MLSVLVFMGMVVLSTIGSGIYLQFAAAPAFPKRWLKIAFGVNALSFVGGVLVLLLLAFQIAAAETATSAAPKEISVGMGLALLGIGLPTAIAALAAGLAVGPIGAAALAVVAEKPEAFGRSLIFVGLAEGIAIYGIVVTILMLGKI